MAENSWPFENADTTEIQFSKWASVLAETGVISGLNVTASGMGVSIDIGNAIVQGMFYENTTAKALAVAAAPAAGQTRLDALILKLDLAANTITALIKGGAANASGGSLPALQQDANIWEHRLRTITVPGGAAALVAGNIGVQSQPTGMRVLVFPAAPTALTGVPRAIGLDLTAKTLSYWDGAAWNPLTAAVAYGALTGVPASFPTTPADFTGVLPVAKGGTGTTDLSTLTVGNATKIGGRQIFVQSGTPAGAAANDLWFW